MISLRKMSIGIARRFCLPSILSKLDRWLHEASLPAELEIGEGTIINKPFHFGSPKSIKIGNNCQIGRGCEFGIVHKSNPLNENNTTGFIEIGNNVIITKALQIYSSVKVVVEDDVMFASNVFVVDCSHGYSNVDKPYRDQAFEKHESVVIKQGAWIGQNVVILQGVEIGEMCIVGSNSVVTRSIPPYSIATGSPARVIKTWSQSSLKWVAQEHG